MMRHHDNSCDSAYNILDIFNEKPFSRNKTKNNKIEVQKRPPTHHEVSDEWSSRTERKITKIKNTRSYLYCPSPTRVGVAIAFSKNQSERSWIPNFGDFRASKINLLSFFRAGDATNFQIKLSMLLTFILYTLLKISKKWFSCNYSSINVSQI